jgi:hypothetical protein
MNNNVLYTIPISVVIGLLVSFYTLNSKVPDTPPTELTNSTKVFDRTNILNDTWKSKILRLDCIPIQEKTYQCVLITK